MYQHTDREGRYVRNDALLIADLRAAQMQHQAELNYARHENNRLRMRVSQCDRRNDERKRQADSLTVRCSAAVAARKIDAASRVAAEERLLDVELLLGRSRAQVVLLSHEVWQAEQNEEQCRNELQAVINQMTSAHADTHDNESARRSNRRQRRA